MDKVISYVFIGILACAIILSFMLILQTQVEPTVTDETITLANGTYVPFGHNPVQSDFGIIVKNASFTLSSGNYTYNTTHIEFLSSNLSKWKEGDWLVTYNYQTSATIWDMDFNYMGMLVFLGTLFTIGLTIILKHDK